MKSIKKSFADCSSCELLDNPSCILETNCEDDLTKVDLIVISEYPGKEEVKAEKPLIGKNNQIFRKYFEKYDLYKSNYLLTNVVLCQTFNEEGLTQNVIETCIENCFNIIDVCKPKLIVLMGGTTLSAFNITQKTITNVHGEILNWNGYKTIAVVHPSFVNNSLDVWEPKFEDAFTKISSIISGKEIEVKRDNTVKVIGQGMHRYKIPEKYYTDEYRLIDVQYLSRIGQVLYIFRDKNNNKIYHKENDTYVCYKIKQGFQVKKIVPYEQLDQISLKYKDRYGLDPEVTYEGDVRITSKHAMDYYHFSKGESKRIFSNIMFMDIEIDTGINNRAFPKPTEAKYPINLISTIYNGEKICFILDNKTEPIQKFDGVTLKIFNNEKELLKGFIKYFKEKDPDFIAGWNLISFDLQYIFVRLPQLGINSGSFGVFNEFYVDGSKYICTIPGCVPVDQDFLYKTFTFTKMENYKLGFISEHELGVTKIELPLPFNEMYWKMLNKTIEYNIRDTELLERLDDKLNHINLLNELRIICNTSFDSVSSFGQIDSLMVSYLNSKNISSKNADPHITKEKYAGAYVFEPTPGAYDWITDFDFASLYPSIMITYNIGINSYVMKTKDPQLGYELTYKHDDLPSEIEVYFDPLNENKLMKVKKEDLLKKITDCNLVTTINGCFFLPHKKELSVFGEIVDMLMKKRKEYKNKMFDAIEKKDEVQERYFNTRQLVYKVLANTLYGVVANKAFRFYDNSLAAAITLSGQEALKTSIIQGNAFLEHLDTGKEFKEPKIVTKKEMFATAEDPISYRMQNRNIKYIITGDTDSIFVCFGEFKNKKDLTVPKILELCAKIETFLNDNKITEVVKKHNGDLDFNRLKLKNELVISRGLFLAKKRYAIRAIANEGKTVDKINYMGLEIKRSDFPRKSKEFLSELSEMILKSEKFSLKKTLNYVKAKENEFKVLIEEGDKIIARPISYGKELDDYKVIPQGVKACEAWNSIMYNTHQPGTKAYMFWVQGIDFDKIQDPKERHRIRENYEKWVGMGNKLEVIAVPDEEKCLPSFFIPNVKAAMKFVFTDRHQLLLAPLTDTSQSVLMTI